MDTDPSDGSVDALPQHAPLPSPHALITQVGVGGNNRLKELKHLEYIIATLGVKHMKQRSNKNTCNNMEQLLQHEIEATETFQKYYCNICAKHMKHPDQNDCNII